MFDYPNIYSFSDIPDIYSGQKGSPWTITAAVFIIMRLTLINALLNPPNIDSAAIDLEVRTKLISTSRLYTL